VVLQRLYHCEKLSSWSASAGREWLKKILQMQKARNEAQLVEELARAGTKKNGELIDTSLSKKFLRCNTNDPARCHFSGKFALAHFK
jgi:DNA gyrase subunit B